MQRGQQIIFPVFWKKPVYFQQIAFIKIFRIIFFRGSFRIKLKITPLWRFPKDVCWGYIKKTCQILNIFFCWLYFTHFPIADNPLPDAKCFP